MKLTLCQIITNTLQGEGPYTGNPTSFYRTVGCNCHCRYCDSTYSWDKKFKDQWTSYSVDELINSIPEQSHLIDCDITGGEVLMHQDDSAFLHFLNTCLIRFKRVLIETNGTIYPNQALIDKFDLIFSVSPKLKSSGVKKHIRYNESALRKLNSLKNSYFKFVISSEDDIQDLLTNYKFIEHDKIYLMPEGATRDKLDITSPYVMKQCLKHKFHFSDRLHVMHHID